MTSWFLAESSSLNIVYRSFRFYVRDTEFLPDFGSSSGVKTQANDDGSDYRDQIESLGL